jgi:hypothetical protein
MSEQSQTQVSKDDKTLSWPRDSNLVKPLVREGDYRAASSRQGLHDLVAKLSRADWSCELEYTTESEHEHATLTYAPPCGPEKRVGFGWRIGESENESLAHVWLWLELKQAEGDWSRGERQT